MRKERLRRFPLVHRSHQVTAIADEGADESVHGQESLCRTGRVDPAQVSRAVPCGLVRGTVNLTSPGQNEAS